MPLSTSDDEEEGEKEGLTDLWPAGWTSSKADMVGDLLCISAARLSKQT